MVQATVEKLGIIDEELLRKPRFEQGMFEDVGDFHRKFDLPHFGDGLPPRLLDKEMLEFRTKFMFEELDEFVDASIRGDLGDAADALADLVYVVLGTAHKMGLPFGEIWAEVQRANMSKVRSTGDNDPLSVRKSKFDVVKPPGFLPPNHERILERARMAAEEVAEKTEAA